MPTNFNNTTPAAGSGRTNVQFATDGSGNVSANIATPVGFANPMTTAGDIILGGASGAPSRLGIGSNGQVPTVSGGTLVYQTPGSVTLSPNYYITWPVGVSPPIFAGWINQNNYTIATSGNDIYLASPGTHTAFYIGAQYKAKIASTFTLTSAMFLNGTDGCHGGIFVSSGNISSGAVITFGLSYSGGGFGSGITIARYNTFTNSFNATEFNPGNLAPSYPFLWLRIVEDATHRTYYVSADGANWIQCLQESVTAFLTTSDYGIEVEGGNNSRPFGCHFPFITETNP